MLGSGLTEGVSLTYLVSDPAVVLDRWENRASRIETINVSVQENQTHSTTAFAAMENTIHIHLLAEAKKREKSRNIFDAGETKTHLKDVIVLGAQSLGDLFRNGEDLG